MPTKSERFVLPLLLAIAMVAAWHFAVVLTGTKIFPSPLAVLRALGELSSRNLLWSYIGDSLLRVFCG